MSLKAVVFLISSCLLSLALASGKVVEENQKRILDNSLTLDKISQPNVNKISDGLLNLENLRSKLPASLAKGVAPRVTIEDSNLPVLAQVAAADCLKQAYEYHDTDADRIELFIALFTQVFPSYQWNAVLDYQHLYYTANYYIRLRTDSGDVLFAFSSNN